MTESDTKRRDETVTVSFIANFEVDPEQVDLRYTKPEKVRNQIRGAIVGCGEVQELLQNTDGEAQRIRERVRRKRRERGR